MDCENKHCKMKRFHMECLMMIAPQNKNGYVLIVTQEKRRYEIPNLKDIIKNIIKKLVVTL